MFPLISFQGKDEGVPGLARKGEFTAIPAAVWALLANALCVKHLSPEYAYLHFDHRVDSFFLIVYGNRGLFSLSHKQHNVYLHLETAKTTRKYFVLHSYLPLTDTPSTCQQPDVKWVSLLYFDLFSLCILVF